MEWARRAKIVCTLGPASDSPAAIRGLVSAGMDVARLNFSHGAHAEHARRLERVRSAAAELGETVGILQDLCGPKIRTGEPGPDAVETGQTVSLRPGSAGDAETIAVDHPTLLEDVGEGDRILLGDGAVGLRVEALRSGALVCRVEQGGALRARMGVNVPSARLQVDAITDKDRADLEFGLASGVDFVALSFVRSADDISALRRLMAGVDKPPLTIAKIETPAAVECIEDIVAEADAVMVARGDLAVELRPEAVPPIQKAIIGTCRRLRRPVIVATEMLHSMVSAQRPTRAESSDVANAIFDGTDAVMLSAETAVGGDPARACATMGRIAVEAEKSAYTELRPSPPSRTRADSVARAACDIAQETGAQYIVALTRSGLTGTLISFARPSVPVVVLSPEPRTRTRLTLYWGLKTRSLELETEMEALVDAARETLVSGGFVAPGDSFVMVFGTPEAPPGSTNAIRVVDT